MTIFFFKTWSTNLIANLSIISKKIGIISRLVNLTESIWPRRGLNMTETDKPYLLEHYRKKTTTNVNLLSLTESDWIWPKEIFLLILPQRWKYTIEVDQKKKILLILPQPRLMLTKYIVISIFGHIHTIIFIVVGNIYVTHDC